MTEPATVMFHFLRPVWLSALLPIVAILLLVLWRQRLDVKWGGVIAPHLLTHLIVKTGKKSSINPAWIVATGMVLGTIALSGPTWRRELPAFVEDKAPLMIALALSSSMAQTDVAPSRLERAKQKIRDLLAARANARTGLIAFAGSAHLVMPLTDDRTVIEPFLAALSPGLMPVDGKNALGAVTLAAQSLAAAPIGGTILIVTDDLGKDEQSALRQAAGQNMLLMLSVDLQPSAGRAPSLRSGVVRVSVDASDIRTLERRIETRFQAAQDETFGTRWRDEGYWLVFPAALLCLAWFRRGTTVAWVLPLFLVFHAWPAAAQSASWLKDLWFTPNQQGMIAFNRGDYATAAERFADPMWRGIAAYRAKDFLTAANEFEHVDSVEGRFAFGNAQAQNHAYEKAVKAYDEVLKAQPHNVAAKTNRAIVLAALEAQKERRRNREQQDSAPDEKADEIRLEPDQRDGKRIQITPEDLTTPGAAEAWMREVQTLPADFLKLKFAIQAATGPAAARASR